MNNKLRFIRYSRKSSEAKEKQIASINDQNIECDSYISKENLHVVYRLRESKTAYKPNVREVFNEMIQLIKQEKAEGIIVWHLNRLCRNPEEGGKLLQMLQDGVIKEIRTTNGDVYTSESDHLVLQIHFGMSNQYSRDLSRTVKRALKHKVERGEYPKGAFVGYKTKGQKGRKNIVPHKTEAPLIKEIFELALTGQYSLVNLSIHLYSKGLVSRSGKRFGKSQMNRILTNTSYYGYFTHNGEMYKGSYIPIITKTIFDGAQKALVDRGKPKINSWKNTSYNGLFKCPTCKSAITTTYKQKHYIGTDRKVTYVYLHCTKRRGAEKCSQPAITFDKFEEDLLLNIMDISIDKKVWELGMKLLKKKNKSEFGKMNKQIDGYNRDHRGYQKKLQRLIDMRADRELTQKEFIVQKSLVLGEQARIEGLIIDVKHQTKNWVELAEQFLNNAYHARKVIEGGEILDKRNLLMDVGKNFVLDDKKIKFSFKMPYDVLLKPEVRTDGRG